MIKWLQRRFDKCATGCLPSDEDDRDYIFRSASEASDEVDLEPHLSNVLYQGSAPSCVAHAVAHAMAIEENRIQVRKSTPSRRWIYYQSRKQHNAISTPLTGTYIRYALKAVRRLGCPPESLCTYSTNASKLNAAPTLKMRLSASSRMGLVYEWIGGDRCKNIRKALSHGHPVIFGTKVGDSLRDYQSGQVLGIPKSTDGGHAMLVIGYRQGKSGYEYKVLNSWHGREIVWFAEEYIDWHMSHDFSIITGWEAI